KGVDAIGFNELHCSFRGIANVLRRIADAIRWRTDLISPIRQGTEVIRTWPTHGCPRYYQLHQASYRLQRDFCADSAELCAWVNTNAILAATISNSRDTRDGFRRNNSGATTNIIGNVTDDDSTLGKARQKKLRLWALTVHTLQFDFKLGAALAARAGVAHLFLRLHTPRLRRIRQGPHTSLVFTTLFFQTICNRQHERTWIRLRVERILIC